MARLIILLSIFTIVAASTDKGRCLCCDADLRRVVTPDKCEYFGFNELSREYPHGRCLPRILEFSCTADIHCPSNYVCSLETGQCVDLLLTGPKPQDCVAVYNSCIGRCVLPECINVCEARLRSCQCDLVLSNCINRFCLGLPAPEINACLNGCINEQIICLG